MALEYDPSAQRAVALAGAADEPRLEDERVEDERVEFVVGEVLAVGEAVLVDREEDEVFLWVTRLATPP